MGLVEDLAVGWGEVSEKGEDGKGGKEAHTGDVDEDTGD